MWALRPINGKFYDKILTSNISWGFTVRNFRLGSVETITFDPFKHSQIYVSANILKELLMHVHVLRINLCNVSIKKARILRFLCLLLLLVLLGNLNKVVKEAVYETFRRKLGEKKHQQINRDCSRKATSENFIYSFRGDFHGDLSGKSEVKMEIFWSYFNS
jgi:hypothetical protein